MKKSNLVAALMSLMLSLFLSFDASAQMVTISNATDCNVMVELGFQSSADPACTPHTPVWQPVPCNSNVTVPFPAGTDVFKGYRLASGDATTGVNVVYHCSVWDPTNCSGTFTIVNPAGCGSCASAIGTCWFNLGGGSLTADYAIRIY